MRASRLVAGTLSALLLGALVAVGAPATAFAQTPAGATAVAPAVLPTDLAGDLAARELAGLPGYRVTVNAEQLTARGGTTERNAWSAQKGAMSAKDVSRYNMRSILGLEKGLGAVDPIRPFPKGQILPSTFWNKIPTPRYTGLGFSNPSSLLLLPATLGWEYRAEMADGLLSFRGMSSSEDLVCAQDFSGATGGFVNWLTGADCEMWKAKAEFIANEGLVPGSTARVCNLAGQCMDLVVLSLNGFGTASDYDLACFSGTTMFQIVWTYANGVSSGGNVQSGVTGCASGLFRSTNLSSRRATNGAITAFRSNETGAVAAPITQTDTDPTRTRICEQTGSDGIVYSGSTPAYKESEIAANGWPALSCAPLPPGVTSNRVRILERSGGLPDKVLNDQVADATPDTDALLGGNAAQYCQTKVCVLDLIIKSSGLTCFSQGEACLGWWDEDAHGDAKYQCNYAGENIAIAECALYAHIFDTQKRLAGNPYSDPVTGEEVGAQTGPSIDGLMMSGVPRASFSGRDCFGSGFSSPNPLQWVLRPLQCFGEWAFVPRASTTVATGESIKNAWAGTFPAQAATMVSGWSLAPSVSGCKKSATMFGVTFDVINACPGSALEGTAALCRTILNLTVLIGAAFAVSRYLGRTVDYTGF